MRLARGGTGVALWVLSSGGDARPPNSCTLTAGLYYICISNRPKTRPHAKAGESAAISQNAACSRKRLTAMPLDEYFVLLCKREKPLRRKNMAAAPQTRLVYNTGKPCLQHKCTLIGTQTSLLYIASKPRLAKPPPSPATKRPFLPFHDPAEHTERELPMSKKITAHTIFAYSRRSGVPARRQHPKGTRLAASQVHASRLMLSGGDARPPAASQPPTACPTSHSCLSVRVARFFTSHSSPTYCLYLPFNIYYI